MILSHSASARRFSVTRNDCFLKTIGVHARESFQCQFCSSRTQVPATVLARTCNRPRTYLRPSLHVLAGKDDNNYFPADTREFIFPSWRVKKKTVSPLGHSLICMYEDVFF